MRYNPFDPEHFLKTDSNIYIFYFTVESQKNFHMNKIIEQAKYTTHPPFRMAVPQIRTHPTPVNHITVLTATEASLQTKVHTTMKFIPPPQPFIPTTTTTTTTTTVATTTTTRTTTRRTKPPTTTTTLPPSKYKN